MRRGTSVFVAALATIGVLVPLSASHPAAAAPAGVHDMRATRPVVVNDTFDYGKRGWAGMFSDYQDDGDNLSSYEMAYDRRAMPAGLGAARRGLYLQSHNRSDDMFMFVTKQFDATDGVRPNTTYRLDVAFDVATNAIDGMGAGGSPGGALHVKVGAVAAKPEIVQAHGGSGVRFVTNFDHGDQSENGRDAVRIGNLAKMDSEDDSYQLKHLTNENDPVYVTSDRRGRLWVFVGTDSGYEGFSHYFIPGIGVTLTPATPPL